MTATWVGGGYINGAAEATIGSGVVSVTERERERERERQTDRQTDRDGERESY